MGEDRICQGAKLSPRICIVATNGRTRVIRARHDKAVGHRDLIVIREEQQLKWGIGQHDTELGIIGRHRLAYTSSRTPRHQHDGLLVTTEQLLRHRARLALATCHGNA